MHTLASTNYPSPKCTVHGLKVNISEAICLHHHLSNVLGVNGSCQCDQHYAVKWNPIKHVLGTSTAKQATC